MKTNLFRNIKLPLLGRGLGGGLFLLCVPVVLAAQNGVTVSGLAVNSGTVTFNVSWNKATMPVTLWSDTVWVFVDYNKNGVMTRLPLSAGATLTATSAAGVGKVVAAPGNNQGVWVVGNARTQGSFSATVKLLTATANLSGACAYASNYPPVGQYISTNVIRFTGTAPYTVMLKGVPEPQMAGSHYMVAGMIDSFTDKTGAPGKLGCRPSTVYTLTASASSFCSGDAGVIFSLSGTQLEQRYELRKGTAVVATLTGSGSAATFSGNMTEGTYTARVPASNGYCEVAMNGSPVISRNALPAAPTGASSNSRCGSGTVTFSATVPGGYTIDWYTASTGTARVNSGGSVTSVSPSLTATTTYYAQARNNTTGCVSTTRLAVTGTVHTVPAPPAMPGSSSYCTSGTITATYGNGGNGIRWDNGSTVTSRPVTATGTYRAVTTSAAGCTSSTATINVTVTLPGTLGNTTNACGCTSGLTACNGYCRNLAADNAVCYKNIEYKVGCLTTDIVPCTSPAGWSQAPLYISDTRAVVLLLNSPLTFWAIETNGSQCRWTVNATVIACTTGGGTQSRYWFYGR